MYTKNCGCEDNCTENIDPCNEGCYENCGCLNPTTFECVTKPGNWPAIDVLDSMNGWEVLQAINNTIADLVLENAPTGNDIYSKVSGTDTTSDYLINKIAKGAHMSFVTINPAGNEQLRIGVDLPSLISTDLGNELGLGIDGKLRVIATAPVVDLVLVQGSGITITGTGPASDPYIISTNPTIQIVRSCFDNIWRNVTLVPTGNASVVYNGGTPQYRYRYDGTIEFKGSATYTIAFGPYTAGTRKFTIPCGAISTSCLTLLEQNGVADLKGITYIDTPQVGADQITQQYNYIIRKNAQNIILEFQSAFLNATPKTIVVNFEGAVSYPNI